MPDHIPSDEMYKYIDCRYTGVVVAARRARQLLQADPTSVKGKPLLRAFDELMTGQLAYQFVAEEDMPVNDTQVVGEQLSDEEIFLELSINDETDKEVEDNLPESISMDEPFSVLFDGLLKTTSSSPEGQDEVESYDIEVDDNDDDFIDLNETDSGEVDAELEENELWDEEDLTSDLSVEENQSEIKPSEFVSASEESIEPSVSSFSEAANSKLTASRASRSKKAKAATVENQEAVTVASTPRSRSKKKNETDSGK